MNVKRSIFLLLFMCMVCVSLSGCSKDAVQAQALPVTEDTESTAPSLPPIAEDTQTAETVEQSDDVDVDLTELVSTLVYAEVYGMMMNPEEYMGKTVKMSGSYYASFIEETNSYYHFVIIEDAAACCQSGLEFIWNGDHAYPDDYPADNTKVEVEGVFDSYDELGQTYYYLSADDIKVLE